MARMSDEAITDNTELIDGFLGQMQMQPDTTFVSNQAAQQHTVASAVPLRTVLENLLVNFRVQGAVDSNHMIGLLLQLEKALESDLNETARVYRMRPNYRSKRGLDKMGLISSIRHLQQGPTKSSDGYSYPGDWAFIDPESVVVQVHVFDLTKGKGEREVLVRQAVPLLAVWVPKRMQADWLAQDQS
jgi:hypothetical protein